MLKTDNTSQSRAITRKTWSYTSTTPPGLTA